MSIRQLMMTGFDSVIMSSTEGYSGWYAFLLKEKKILLWNVSENASQQTRKCCYCCCGPFISVVDFFRERADDDLRPVAFWIIARHQLLKDRLVLVVVTAESLHEAPQTALHGYSQRGILQTDVHPWERAQTVNSNMCNSTEFTASLQKYEPKWDFQDNYWLNGSKPNDPYDTF